MKVLPLLALTLILSFLCTPLYTAPAWASPPLQLNKAERDWLKAHPTITVAFDGNFPPYSFLNDSGELEGFVVEVMQLVTKQAGLQIQTHPQYEWKQLYESAKQAASGAIDPGIDPDNATAGSAATTNAAAPIDVVATMVDRPNRHRWFLFTTPYVYKSLIVIDRSDDRLIAKRQDIANKTIAVVQGYHYVERVLEEFPNVKPLFVDSMQEAMNAVSVGDADATIGFLGAAHYYRSKYLFSNLRYATTYDRQTANDAMAIRKSAPELASILQKSLNAIPENQLQALRAKWLPVDYMEELAEIELTEAEQQWIANHPKIRLGVDPEFAPFEFLEEERYRGMASDYIKLLNRRLNLNMEVVKGISWKEAIRKAQSGDIDVLPAVGLTAERQSFLNYTEAYLKFHRVIVTRTDAPFIAGLNDIDHLPVAVQSNSSHHGYLQEQTQLSLSPYPTQQEALLAVSGGQAIAFVGNVASATYWIRKLNLNNLKIAAPVSSEVQSLHFAVRKDWPELHSILQKGLNSISPRQQKLISEKWLSVDYDPVVDYSLIWRLGGLFSALVVAVFIWNLMLNRQVRLRTSQLDYSANYDQLSGLPNRFLIMDRLKQYLGDAQRNQTKMALLSIDIDDFKKVNDGFDHKTGDELIKCISQRLKSNLRDSDNVGHLGADHFLVIQNHIGEVSDSALLAEKLLGCFDDGFIINGYEINITASIGIAIYPDDSGTAEELLKHSSTATYHTKNRLHDGYTFYTKNLMQNVSRRLELDRHMRSALQRQEFVVFYQPKVEAKTGRIVSFEALIRWFNPELGMVSPVEFIPIAEKNGIIERLGAFVIEQAMAQLSQWQQRFDSEFSMAINLSPVQFRSHDLIPLIESALLKNSLSGRSIEFEITEGVLLADSPSDHPNVEEKLHKLESLGINLSMDDFGTGYSSMSYLRKYKFNQLKIDGEFIHDLVSDESDQKLVSATIAMAHGLGMKVVAERVETEAQRQWLADAGCDYLQGWLFSKASSVEDITRLLEEQFISNNELTEEEIHD